MGLSRKDLDEQYDLGHSESRLAFQEQMREQIGAANKALVDRLEERLTQAERTISELETEMKTDMERLVDQSEQMILNMGYEIGCLRDRIRELDPWGGLE